MVLILTELAPRMQSVSFLLREPFWGASAVAGRRTGLTDYGIGTDVLILTEPAPRMQSVRFVVPDSSSQQGVGGRGVSLKIWSNIGPNLVRNVFEIGPKLVQNWFGIGSTLVRNWTNIDPKWSNIG